VNLGFDIDGVIADFEKPLIQTVKENYGRTIKETDIYCFNLNVVLGITKTEESQLIAEVLKKDLPLYFGAKETLEQLNQDGHRIYLLTGRYYQFHNITESWLKQKGVLYDQLHLLKVGEKHRANIESLDLVVEDSLEEALEWSQKIRNVLVYDHPWNKTLNIKNLTKRVHNWKEIYGEIKKLNAVGGQSQIGE
jgi:uncharacterized HAD superfamily protein